MKALSSKAIESIIELMCDKDFIDDLQSVLEDSLECKDERDYVDLVTIERIKYYRDHVEVVYNCRVSVPYVNDTWYFIFPMDFDYKGEAL